MPFVPCGAAFAAVKHAEVNAPCGRIIVRLGASMRKYWKFGALMAVIVGSLLWLATAGISSSQSYYKTISELNQMGPTAQTRHLRVSGDIKANSITKADGIVKFTLVQDKLALNVAYEGRDPLPDT